MACARVDFELSDDVARRGLFLVRETGGKELIFWEADDGWRDSGWFRDIDISFESVYVQVFYYQGPDRAPIEMQILNPAPGTSYGWMARGMCHALEVAWPDGAE